MAKGAAAGKSFIAGVLEKLSPEDRQKGEEAWKTLESLGGGTVVAAVGDGTLAQGEFSRLTNELTAKREELDARAKELEARDQGLTMWHGDLTNWYSGMENELKTDGWVKTDKGTWKRPNRSGNGNGNPNPNPDPSKPAPGGFTEEIFNERMAQERASFLGFARDQSLITEEHFKKFGEIVALEPLLRHPQIAQLGLLGVYELVHKDRLDKWKTDAQAAHDKKVGEEAVRKHLESNAQMPYPTPTGAGSGSPLDALTTGANSPLVDKAVAEYNRLQGERTAGRPAV